MFPEETPRQTSTSAGALIDPAVIVGTKIVRVVLSEHPFLVTVTPTTASAKIVPTGAV